MADAKKPEPKPEPPRPARASESGDPAVQQILAEREIHRANDDTERVVEATRRLAELGYV